MSDVPDRLLQFLAVAGGGRGYWHIYYGRYYVGSIFRSSGGWRVWHHDYSLGEFADLEQAQRAVAVAYYGPDAEVR